MKDNKFSNSEIAVLADTSRENVKKVTSGIPIKNEEIAQKINFYASFDKSLMDLFLDPDFYELCKVALSKSRNNKVKRLAVFCQNASETIRYKLGISDEMRTDKE